MPTEDDEQPAEQLRRYPGWKVSREGRNYIAARDERVSSYQDNWGAVDEVDRAASRNWRCWSPPKRGWPSRWPRRRSSTPRIGPRGATATWTVHGTHCVTPHARRSPTEQETPDDRIPRAHRPVPQERAQRRER